MQVVGLHSSRHAGVAPNSDDRAFRGWVFSAEQLKSILGVVTDVLDYLLRKSTSERSMRLFWLRPAYA